MNKNLNRDLKNRVVPSILVLTSSFPRWSGDTDSCFVSELSQKLAQHFNIIVLCPHTKESKTYEVIDNCNVYRFRYAPEIFEVLAYDGGIQANLKKKKLRYLLLPLFFCAQILSIFKLLRQYPIDIVHAHWIIPQGLSASIALSFFTKKINLVTTSHGGDLFSLNSGISHYLKQQVISRSTKLTVVSQVMKDFIVTNFRQPTPTIDVISMGTDLQHTFTPAPKKIRQDNRLLFVGRLVEKKGVKHLLKAIAYLLPKRPELELQIIGSGPDMTFLKLITDELGLQKNVHFLGHVPHNDLVNYYHQATIAVFPFQIAQSGDQEGLGLVVVEAMGCGCPIIAGDVPAVHDTIVDGKTGLLVSPSDTELFAQTINKLLDDKRLQKKLALEARKHVLNRYDWSYIAEKYKQLFLNL